MNPIKTLITLVLIASLLTYAGLIMMTSANYKINSIGELLFSIGGIMIASITYCLLLYLLITYMT